MKKYLLIFWLSALSIQAASDYPPVGLKYKLAEYPRLSSMVPAAVMLGHLGFNALFAYFQMTQAEQLQIIPYADNEAGVAEENKKCGPLCQENSKNTRDAARQATNLNYVATLASGISAISNMVAFAIWIAMQVNFKNRNEYWGNIEKFQRIAFGASAFNALLDFISTTKMVNIAIYYVKDVPLKTIAPFQVAIATGMGYALPTILFGSSGLVKMAELIEAARAIAMKFYELLPQEDAQTNQPVIP